jgi:hypothetical protein
MNIKTAILEFITLLIMFAGFYAVWLLTYAMGY